jgi:hypothetical protein
MDARIYDPAFPSEHRAMQCSDIHYSDAQFLKELAIILTGKCDTYDDVDEGDTGYDFINIKCENPMSEWNATAKELGQACWAAEPYREKKGPWFRNDKFYSQPK